MNVFTVASIVILVTLTLAFLIAFPFVLLSRLVSSANEDVEASKTRYNPNATIGHNISMKADYGEQVKEARILAARRAASMQRGANMGIGRKGDSEELRAASKGLEEDPISAVKIANYHTWQGAVTGPVAAAAAAPVAAAAAAGPMVKRKLVAGTDFEFTPVDASLPGAEKRRLRIQNSKAKLAAYKALKASGQDMVASAAPAAGGVAAAAPAAAAAAPVGIPDEPEYVDLTDDMAPDEKRKARINNSKMRSAYNKQLKALGIDPKTKQPIGGAAAAAPAVAAPVAAAAPVAEVAAPAAAASNLPPAPEYVELTDDMDPADKRAARINNSKMRSAYNKQLKALGIDPKTLQ